MAGTLKDSNLIAVMLLTPLLRHHSVGSPRFVDIFPRRVPFRPALCRSLPDSHVPLCARPAADGPACRTGAGDAGGVRTVAPAAAARNPPLTPSRPAGPTAPIAPAPTGPPAPPQRSGDVPGTASRHRPVARLPVRRPSRPPLRRGRPTARRSAALRVRWRAGNRLPGAPGRTRRRRCGCTTAATAPGDLHVELLPSFDPMAPLTRSTGYGGRSTFPGP